MYGPDSEVYGWATGETGPETLTIDGVSETGRYCYVDLSTIESNPVRAFEIWANREGTIPRDFYIIGSNDGVNFTKLYDNSDVNVFTHETPAGSNGRVNIYSDVIHLSNNTVYSHIGIFVASTYNVAFEYPNGPNANVVVQELRLFK